MTQKVVNYSCIFCANNPDKINDLTLKLAQVVGVDGFSCCEVCRGILTLKLITISSCDFLEGSIGLEALACPIRQPAK